MLPKCQSSNNAYFETRQLKPTAIRVGLAMSATAVAPRGWIEEQPFSALNTAPKKTIRGPILLILVSRITISLAFGGLTIAQWNEG